MNPLVLSLCDLTGHIVEPWLAAGYECWIVDLQHPPGETRDGLLVRVGADVHTFLPPRRDYAFCAAFPSCTDFAVSGARWFKAKGLMALAESLMLVERCRRICEWTGAPWFVENPVGTLKTYWRDWDHSFDPCDYGGYLDPPGDAYTKKTLLWTGGGLVMPEPRPVLPTEGSKMHRLPPSDERANLRSATPRGFAHAMFAANHRGAASLETAR